MGRDSADDFQDQPTRLPSASSAIFGTSGGTRSYAVARCLPKSFHTLLGDKRAQMVFTDPPYNVRFTATRPAKAAFSTVSSKWRRRAGCTRVYVIPDTVLFADGQSIASTAPYTSCVWTGATSGELLEAGRLAYTELKNVCVWVKDNGGMGSLYRSQHELVFVFKNGTASHRNNVNSVDMGGTAPMSGITRVPTPSAANRMKVIWRLCIQP